MFLVALLSLFICSAVECALTRITQMKDPEENKTVAFRGSWHLAPGASLGNANGTEGVLQRLLSIFPEDPMTSQKDLRTAKRLDRKDDNIAIALISGLVLMTLTVCCVLAILNAEDPDASPPSRPPGWPLTPMLVVPDGKIFLFRVPALVNTSRQKCSFDILDCHGDAVCAVTVDEPEADRGGVIRLETKVEERLLAYVLTEPVEEKTLRICKPDGTVFALISEKADLFVVHKENRTLLTCYGDFLNHHVRVLDTHHRKAGISQPDRDGYTGSVASNEDGGLVLCTLLAIDKLVQPVPKAQKHWQEQYLEAENSKSDTRAGQKEDPFFQKGSSEE